MENEKRYYCDIENDLKRVLNLKYVKNRTNQILSLLNEFKESHETTLSTKYLMGLVEGENCEKKTKKVFNMLKAIPKTKVIFNFYEKVSIIRDVDVVEYGFNKWNEPIIKDITVVKVRSKEFLAPKQRVFKMLDN